MARPPVKQQLVVEDLRSQIVRGHLTPGAQLPTLDDLETHYQISRVTASRVVDILRQDGFVLSVGKTGCFVAENPPHLYRYGLVFPRRSTRLVPQGWRMLADKTARTGHGANIEIALYNSGELAEVESDKELLLSDIRSHRLAGIIYVFRAEPDVYELAQRYALPKVMIHTNGPLRPYEPQPPAGIPFVTFDYRSFCKRSVEWMASRQRRRVAVMGVHKVQVEAYAKALPEMNIATEPYWLLSAGLDELDRAKDLVRLLMRGPREERPDGLIMTDDNFALDAAAGLVEAGIKVPADLEVVAFTNWPTRSPGIAGAVRLGFDARQILQAAMTCIDQQRRGKKPPADQLVRALFENEVVA